MNRMYGAADSLRDNAVAFIGRWMGTRGKNPHSLLEKSTAQGKENNRN
jgi:hypothetical protein